MDFLGELLTTVIGFLGASAISALAVFNVAGSTTPVMVEPVVVPTEEVLLTDDLEHYVDFSAFSTNAIEDEEATTEVLVLSQPEPAQMMQALVDSQTLPLEARFSGLLAHVRWLINQDGRIEAVSQTGGVSRELFDKQIEKTADNINDSIDSSVEDLEDDISGLTSRLLTAETTLAGISLAAASTSVMAANLTLNGHWLSGDGADEGVFVTAAGNVGVGTSTASSRLTVAGDLFATGAFRDSTNAAGTAGYVLQTTGSGTEWVATSTLGFTSGGGGSLFTDSGAFTYLTSGDNLGIGTTTPQSKLTVAGDISLTNNLNLQPTASSGAGVVTVAGERFIHGYTPDSTYGRNLFMGYQAGNFTMGSSTNLALGNSNVGIGEGVLGSLTEGGSNTAVGFSALGANTTGGTNVAVGWYSMLSNTTGGANVAVGRGTLQSNMDGRFNTALGNAAMEFNVSGENNVAVGAYALQNTNSYYNVGIGQGAGGSITSGEANTIIGFDSGSGITTGGHNTIIGANVTGLPSSLSNNIILADGAGNQRINVDSSGNVGLGTSTPSSRLTIAGDLFATGAFRDSSNASGTAGMVLQTTGSGTQWVATSSLGFPGGSGVTTFLALTDTPGSFSANRIMYTNSGATALTDSSDFIYDGTNLGLGGDDGIAFNGVRYITASTTRSSIAIGQQALVNFTGTSNLGFGDYAFGSTTAVTSGGYNIAIGGFSLYDNTSSNFNTAVGYSSLRYNTSGSSNSAYGSNAMYYNTTGYDNTAIGLQSLYDNTTGNSNTSVGRESLGDNTSGSSNTALGLSVLARNTTGNLNTGAGAYSLYRNTGSDNTAYGAYSLYDNTTGTQNVASGRNALWYNTDGNNNIAVGYHAGAFLTNGSSRASSTDYSVYLGSNVKALTSNDQNSIIIGYNANGLGSDTVVLGNDSIITTALKGNVGIGTTTPGSKLTIVGDIFATGALRDSSASAGTAGMVLQTTGSGTQWVATSSLGITGGGSLFTDGGAVTYLTATGDNLAIGTTTAGSKLTVEGDLRLYGGINFGGGRAVYQDAGSNLMVGEYALFYNDDPDVYANTAVGATAGNNLRSGFSNTFVGFGAGTSLATGSRSVILGNQAVGGTFGTADLGEAVVIGDGAGYDLASGGSFSTFVGFRAGENVTTGGGNTLFGWRAGDNITTGWENIVIGYDIDAPSASSFQTLNIGNLIFGTDIDGTGTTLSNGNIGIGTSTPDSKLTVAGDIFATGIMVDDLVQFNNSEGRTLLGYQAGQNLVASSSLNTFVGYQAGFSSSTASTDVADFNTGIGYRAVYSNTSGVFLSAVGAGALENNTSGISNTALGVQSLNRNTIGSYNTGTGVNSLYTNTTGSSNSAYGYLALFSNSTGNFNTAVGFEALTANATGSNNTAVGYEALTANTFGIDNAANGFRSLFSNTTGSYNGAQGTNALFSNTTGSYNAAQGTNALYSNTTGDLNAAQGVQALFSNTVGTSTTAAGALALYSNVAGSHNSAFGSYAGYELNSATGTGANTLVGYNTGRGIVTGINNTIIGANVTGLTSSLSNNIIIADGAGNQRINVGSTGNVGIGTSTPDSKLTVAGTIRSTSLLGGSTNLTTDAAGNIIRDPSDARLKENVVTIENALDTVLALRGVRYEWIDKERFGDQFEIGFIAQEVDELVPEVVQKGGEYWSLNSKNLIAVVVEAMKEMWATVSGHEERLVELESENNELKARLEAVEAELGGGGDTNPTPAPQPEPTPEVVVDDGETEAEIETTEPDLVDTPEGEPEPIDEVPTEPEEVPVVTEEVVVDTPAPEPFAPEASEGE